MHILQWLDKTAKEPVTLHLQGRTIYKATTDVNIDVASLKGHVLFNINPDIVRIPHWLVFQDEITMDICIAPVYDSLVDTIIQEPEIFYEPVNIRLVYEMLGL